MFSKKHFKNDRIGYMGSMCYYVLILCLGNLKGQIESSTNKTDSYCLKVAKQLC